MHTERVTIPGDYFDFTLIGAEEVGMIMGIIGMDAAGNCH